MARRHYVLIAAVVLAIGLGGTAAALGMGNTARHLPTTRICREDTAPAARGRYVVQNNEFGTGAAECIATSGGADFTVANSSISVATDGPPGGYPSIFQGCHWGKCSSGGLAGAPVRVSELTGGKVTTSWSTSQPGGSNAYDVAYDIWFNRTPTTSGQPDCAELMIWLNHNGSVQPRGSQAASNVRVGGHRYNVWEGRQPWGGDTVTYDMVSGTSSVIRLWIGRLAQDAVSRGYISRSCYLIDVEAGFEIWRGGAGLATTFFSVSVHGRQGSPARPPAADGVQRPALRS